MRGPYFIGEINRYTKSQLTELICTGDPCRESAEHGVDAESQLG